MKNCYSIFWVVACSVCLLSGCGGGGGTVAAGTGTGSVNQVWQQVVLDVGMLAGGTNIEGIYAAKDSYLYVSTSVHGTWRAKVTDIRANPASVGWTRIDAGFPNDPVHGGTSYILTWAEDSSGNLFGSIGVGVQGAPCTSCVVGKWNGSIWTFSNNPAGTRTSIEALAFDGSGNLFINDRSGGFYESTDGGKTFGGALVSNAYVKFGQPSGYVFTNAILNGQMYWGGEGPYMRSPLDFSTGAVIQGATGFTGNATAFASDGTASIAPTYIIAAGRCDPTGYCMQRYLGSTNIWTNLGAKEGIPQYVGFGRGKLVNGSVVGEYFASFRAAGASGGGGVIRSADGGQTWSNYNTGLPLIEQSFAGRITVDPLTDSKFVEVALSGTGGGLEVWYHP